jgi:hypothetical protein
MSGIAILTAGFIAVVGAQPRTQSPSDFKYYFPSGPAADDASEHYTQLGDGNPCGLQAQATLDIVNKSRDKTLRVHLNRSFYLVIDATTARALREPPRGARARYVQDFEIPPKTTQHETTGSTGNSTGNSTGISRASTATTATAARQVHR